MIIVTCKEFPFVKGNYNNLFFNEKNYVSSIEYIDNGYDEVLIKEVFPKGFTFRNLKSQLHNPIGSAIKKHNDISSQFYEAYYINNSRHRTDGPAIIYSNQKGSIEYKEYWYRGKYLSEDLFESIVKNDYSTL